MRLGKYWKESVTAFIVKPDNWRPRNDRVWKKFVKASCRLKLEKDQSIKVFQLGTMEKGRFKALKKSVIKPDKYLD